MQKHNESIIKLLMAVGVFFLDIKQSKKSFLTANTVKQTQKQTSKSKHKWVTMHKTMHLQWPGPEPYRKWVG